MDNKWTTRQQNLKSIKFYLKINKQFVVRLLPNCCPKKSVISIWLSITYKTFF